MNIDLGFTHFDWGSDYYKQLGVMMPANDLDTLKNSMLNHLGLADDANRAYTPFNDPINPALCRTMFWPLQMLPMLFQKRQNQIHPPVLAPAPAFHLP